MLSLSSGPVCVEERCPLLPVGMTVISAIVFFLSRQVWCLRPSVLLPPGQQSTASTCRLWLLGTGPGGG